MESDTPIQVVISKEDAVFWMDENGQWHNEHGKFEHPRIIKHFNTSIKKDTKGFYVAQSTDQVEEKVYFKYKETAIFVVDLKQKDTLILILNTGRTAQFDPKQLMVKNDRLFVRTKECLIKFSSQAMVKISRYLKEEEGKLMFSLDGKSWPID